MSLAAFCAPSLPGLWTKSATAATSKTASPVFVATTARPITCQHISFLSILCDIVEKKHDAAVLKKVLNKTADIVGIGSPFAWLYLYEMMDKEGLQNKIIESIYRGCATISPGECPVA